MKEYNVYTFKWMTHSMDQECNIVASSQESAWGVFREQVIGDGEEWAANHATVHASNLVTVSNKVHFVEDDLLPNDKVIDYIIMVFLAASAFVLGLTIGHLFL